VKVKFPSEMSLSISTGLLFLRLVCPIFIKPHHPLLEKYIKTEPTLQGLRALVVVAKILQKIGSVESLHTLSDEERKSIENDSNHLNLIDRVIKKYNLLWKNYFHRLFDWR